MHFYPVLANILRCTNCVPITSVSFGKYTSINAKTSGLAVLVQVWQFWHLYQPPWNILTDRNLTKTYMK